MNTTKTVKCRVAAAWYQQTGIRVPRNSRITVKYDDGFLHTRHYGDIHFMRAIIGREWQFPAYLYCLM